MEPKAALRHAEIVGNVQIGRGGVGLGSGKPVWNQRQNKANRGTCREEYILRGAKVVAQAKKGQWLNQENVEKKTLGWGGLWKMEKSLKL